MVDMLIVLGNHVCGKTMHITASMLFAFLYAQDVVRRYKEAHDDWDEFPTKVAFQMNDTHPTLLGMCCPKQSHRT